MSNFWDDQATTGDDELFGDSVNNGESPDTGGAEVPATVTEETQP